jgi:hypothetical protein
MTSHEFEVGPRLRLILSDVSLTVRVRRGSPGTAAVEVGETGGGEGAGGEGAGGDAHGLDVRYDAATNVLDLRQDPPATGGVTVAAAGGSVVVGAGGSVTRTGSVVAAGSGGVTVVNSGGRVVVNGVDVTEQVAGAAPQPPPVVTVTVPQGTDIGAERCVDLTVAGVGGRLRAVVVGGAVLVATSTTAARLTVGGQSRAELRRSSGDIGLTVTGQARAHLEGDFGDVELELSGQARVEGSGSFGRVSGEATGMSRVDLHGPAAAQAVRTSGMAAVYVGGPPRGGAATGDDWDF